MPFGFKKIEKISLWANHFGKDKTGFVSYLWVFDFPFSIFKSQARA